MQATTLTLALTLAAAFAAGSAQAANTTLTFQHGANGYLGSADTTLMSSDSAGDHGADEEVSIDASDGGSPNHVLLRFDGLFGNGAGQIKATDSIVKATLSVQITSAGSGIQFHDMLVAWNESASWDSMGDGIQANGVEAVVAPFLSVGDNNGASNIPEAPMDFDLTASLQAMQSGAVPGYGWALLPFMPDGTNGVDFLTKEAFNLADRPLLTVEVAPVPEPETYALMLAGLGLIGFMARRARRA